MGRRGGRWGERVARDTREKKGRRTQGRPAGLPAAPQEAERPQRSHSSPSGTPRGEHHHHRGAHLSHTRKHTLALAASHGHPRHLSRPSCTPRHSPCLTSRQDSFPRAPGAETTEPTGGFLRAHSHQQADRGRGSHSSQLGNHVRNSRKARTSGTGSQPLSLCGKARDWIKGAANGSVEPGRGGRGPNTPPKFCSFSSVPLGPGNENTSTPRPDAPPQVMKEGHNPGGQSKAASQKPRPQTQALLQVVRKLASTKLA